MRRYSTFNTIARLLPLLWRLPYNILSEPTETRSNSSCWLVVVRYWPYAIFIYTCIFELKPPPHGTTTLSTSVQYRNSVQLVASLLIFLMHTRYYTCAKKRTKTKETKKQKKIVQPHPTQHCTYYVPPA